MTRRTDIRIRRAGSIMLIALVYGAIFLLVLSALAGYLLSENSVEDATRVRAEALAIAEGGLDYYKWHLAHFPTDLKNGTNSPGPYNVTVPNPEGGTAGTAALTITANTACGQTQSVDISSKGVAADGPNEPVTVVARYAEPSVASYSYIVNASVWAGADRTINGPYHSNGGIRMDGTANAPVTSSISTWDCTSDFGCSPEQKTAPGVVGSGTNQDLWGYPTPQVNFAGIAANFSSLKSTAQSSGLYFPRYSSGNSNSAAYHKGYHFIFNANGTVTVKRVTAVTRLTNVLPVANPTAYTDDYTLINNETTFGTYTIPANCGLIFVEDNAWIEGTIPAKVTVVVANVSNAGVVPEVVLPGNITYASTSGSDGLTIISDDNILIGPNSPQNMTLDGVFIAQGGAFGRNYYYYAGHACDGTYEPRGTLTILGSTISNLRTGTAWVNGCSTGQNAGYRARVDAFDRTLAGNPPPFTPVTSSDYEFVDWQEK